LKYSKFKEYVKESAEKFKQIDKKETVRLISHLDADGISAAAILVKLFNKENMKYSISIVQQLKEQVIKGLANEAYKYFIFSDLGSGQLNFIKKYLHDRTIFVLDHHKPEEVEADNIVHVNPHLFDIDGSNEISGAGVVYLFAKEVNNEMKQCAHVAIIGAMGDIQEQNGFLKLNKEILDDAVANEKIKVIKGLRVFGAQTRALHKVLEYCSDPFIPGVSGSESGAIQFLQQIGINPKKGKDWVKLVQLSEEDIKKLATGIIMKRLGEEKPEDILGDVYILKEEEKESPLRDVKEFSTLLNACGRLGKASLGIGACLGDEKTKARAISSLGDYKKEIVKAINWYKANKDSMVSGEGFQIINTKENIMPTIVGTLASIVSKSNYVKDGTYILAMADLLDGNTKVSLRFAGRGNEDLREIVKEITKNIPEAEAGGHMNAAGAIIPNEREEELIAAATEILSKKGIEEKIL